MAKKYSSTPNWTLTANLEAKTIYSPFTINYNQLQPIYYLFTVNYNAIRWFTMGMANNYNSIVIKSSVLCTMACQQALMDCQQKCKL